MFHPRGGGPHPSAVIIHGSGTRHRDNGWYLALTAHLQSAGIAVLLPEKRESEESQGERRTASFNDPAGSLIHWRQSKCWDAVGNPNPLPLWRDLSVPALVAYGSGDPTAPVRRSVHRLESIENPLISIGVWDGSGHPIQDPPGEGRSFFREAALAEIGDYIMAADPGDGM